MKLPAHGIVGLQEVISHVAGIDTENYQTKQPILTCDGCGGRYIKCREPQIVCVSCINAKTRLCTTQLDRSRNAGIIRTTGNLTITHRVTLLISDTTPPDGITDDPTQLHDTTNSISHCLNDDSDLDKLPDGSASSRPDSSRDSLTEAANSPSDVAITLF